jgi:hypothetical protein
MRDEAQIVCKHPNQSLEFINHESRVLLTDFLLIADTVTLSKCSSKLVSKEIYS